MDKRKAKEEIAKGRGRASAESGITKIDRKIDVEFYNKANTKKQTKEYVKQLRKDATKGYSKGTKG